MSKWTKQELETFVSDYVEESLSLEYKAADSLNPSNGGMVEEITKDVSAFANASGGVLIYGIAEFREKAKRQFPERLDPLGRGVITKERLEQIIQTIQPRIDGVAVHPVTISKLDNTVCYVVEIPQSHTAHQARDHKYYKRHNFNALPMEDYEVRDVMNRRTHPKIKACILINRATSRTKHEGLILVKLENTGRVLANHVMVELEVPIDLNGVISVEGPVTMERDANGDFFHTKLTLSDLGTPIFPGSSVTLSRKIQTHVRIEHIDKTPLNSRRYIQVSVFADEMPPLRAKLDIAPVLTSWTAIQSNIPS